MEKLSSRFLPWLLLGAFLLVSVPVLLLSLYNHPSPADDYCFADTSLRYGFWQAQRYYYDGWSGRFVHNFIVHGSPLVFGWNDGYKVYPILLYAGLVWAFVALAGQWLGAVAPRPVRWAAGAGGVVFFVAALAGLPEFMYWYAGMACYSLACVLFVALLATLLAHHKQGYDWRSRYVLGESLLIVGIIGSSETCAVMALSVLAFIALNELWQRRTVSLTTLLLLAVGGISAYYLLSAEGNTVRFNTNPGSRDVVATVRDASRYMVGYVARILFKTPLLPLTLLYLPLAARLVARERPAYLRVPLWLAVGHGLATVFVLISLHYWGVGIAPVARIINATNLFFFVSWFYNVTLWVAAFRQQRSVLITPAVTRIGSVAVAVWLLATLAFNPTIRMMYDDLRHQRPQQFDRAMQERYVVMQRSADADTVRLGPLPAYPASLFTEDIHDDPKHWWNKCWAQYYHHPAVVLDSTLTRPVQSGR